MWGGFELRAIFRGFERFAERVNRERVGAALVPIADGETLRCEQAADACRIPAENVFEHGNENAHGIVAEHGTLGDARDEFVLGDGDCEAVALIDVHHHRQIGTAVADIDDAIGAEMEFRALFFEDGDLAPSGRGANNGLHFAG